MPKREEVQRLIKEKRYHEQRETLYGILCGSSGALAIILSAAVAGQAKAEHTEVSSGLVVATLVCAGATVATLVPGISHYKKRIAVEDKLKEIELTQKVSLAVFENKNERLISLKYRF